MVALFLESETNSSCFVFGFLEFILRVGICDNSGSDVVVEVVVFLDQGTNGDVELRFSVEAEISNDAGVEPSRDGLEFGNDFGCSDFWGAGNGPSGEAGLQGVDVIVFGAEGATDGRDEVVDVLKVFELEEV